MTNPILFRAGATEPLPTQTVLVALREKILARTVYANANEQAGAARPMARRDEFAREKILAEPPVVWANFKEKDRLEQAKLFLLHTDAYMVIDKELRDKVEGILQFVEEKNGNKLLNDRRTPKVFHGVDTGRKVQKYYSAIGPGASRSLKKNHLSQSQGHEQNKDDYIDTLISALGHDLLEDRKNLKVRELLTTFGLRATATILLLTNYVEAGEENISQIEQYQRYLWRVYDPQEGNFGVLEALEPLLTLGIHAKTLRDITPFVKEAGAFVKTVDRISQLNLLDNVSDDFLTHSVTPKTRAHLLLLWELEGQEGLQYLAVRKEARAADKRHGLDLAGVKLPTHARVSEPEMAASL